MDVGIPFGELLEYEERETWENLETGEQGKQVRAEAPRYVKT